MKLLCSECPSTDRVTKRKKHKQKGFSRLNLTLLSNKKKFISLSRTILYRSFITERESKLNPTYTRERTQYQHFLVKVLPSTYNRIDASHQDKIENTIDRNQWAMAVCMHDLIIALLFHIQIEIFDQHFSMVIFLRIIIVHR